MFNFRMHLDLVTQSFENRTVNPFRTSTHGYRRSSSAAIEALIRNQTPRLPTKRNKFHILSPWLGLRQPSMYLRFNSVNANSSQHNQYMRIRGNSGSQPHVSPVAHNSFAPFLPDTQPTLYLPRPLLLPSIILPNLTSAPFSHHLYLSPLNRIKATYVL